MNPTQKRKLEESEPPNYQEIAEKYKDKLIILARAYAKLLNTIESYAAVQKSSANKMSKGRIQNNPNNSIEEDENAVTEENDDQLLCCSQLDDYKDSQEEESPSDFMTPLYKYKSTKPDLSMDDYNNCNNDNLTRYDSVASQKSTFFSTFIENCGDDLGPIPELDGLINLDSIYSIPPPLMEKIDDDASETDTILITNQSLFPCHVRVNVVVLVKDPNNSLNVFTSIKKDAYGDDAVFFPGGYLEMGESFEECANREINQQTGLSLQNIKYIHTTNNIFNCNKHHVTVFMSAGICNNDAKSLNPIICQEWTSYSWQQINEIASGKRKWKLYGPLLNLMRTEPSSLSQLFFNSVSP